MNERYIEKKKLMSVLRKNKWENHYKKKEGCIRNKKMNDRCIRKNWITFLKYVIHPAGIIKK